MKNIPQHHKDLIAKLPSELKSVFEQAFAELHHEIGILRQTNARLHEESVEFRSWADEADAIEWSPELRDEAVRARFDNFIKGQTPD